MERPIRGYDPTTSTYPWVRVDPDGNLHVIEGGSSKSISGGASFSQNATPAALPSLACSQVAIQNDPASTNNLKVGNISGQWIVLIAGAGVVIECTNANEVYTVASSGSATVNYMGVD